MANGTIGNPGGLARYQVVVFSESGTKVAIILGFLYSYFASPYSFSYSLATF
jgi:hypothetical protein